MRTPADFGLQGEQPTHPVLLDWLAVDLQDRKWNLKAMLKQMVMSRTFQQSSARRAQVNDPENRLWARGRVSAWMRSLCVTWRYGPVDFWNPPWGVRV